jgi:hypothetical protein
MRCVVALLVIVGLVAPAAAAPSRKIELTSREAILAWVWSYRAKADPARVPAAIKAMSETGAFRDPDSAGVYVGFIAGVIAAHPARAEELIAKALPLPGDGEWALVRAVAYSGAPEWKELLRRIAPRLPARQAMIDKYLAGKLPTFDHLVIGPDPGFWQKVRGYTVDVFKEKPPKPVLLEPSPDLVDTLWGYYFATGAYSPLGRLVAMLPWSKHQDNVEKLTVGSMAKFTLVANSARDTRLLAVLKWARTQQGEEIGPILDEVIEAAETVDTARVRKEAFAALEELKRKGPGSKRNVAWWGQVGEGAIALGCLAAAVAGQVEFGLPCVVGGALTSAGLKYWAAQ